MLIIASICSWFLGLGFGIPGIYGIWYFLKNKSIPNFMGFTTYGNGPFEKIGIHTTTPLLAGFLMLCVFQCICGWGIWNAEKGIVLLSFLLIPVELFFYIGFALPFGPPFVIIRTLLLIFLYNSLK